MSSTHSFIEVMHFSFSVSTGVAPPSFVFVQAGTTLHKLTSTSEAWNLTNVGLLAVFAVVAILPVAFKGKLRSKLEWQDGVPETRTGGVWWTLWRWITRRRRRLSMCGLLGTCSTCVCCNMGSKAYYLGPSVKIIKIVTVQPRPRRLWAFSFSLS